MKKAETTRFQEHRRKENYKRKLKEERYELLELVQQDYKSILRERADFPILMKHMREIGLPKMPSYHTLEKDLENIIDVSDKIGEKVTSYIANEINENENRMLNKVSRFFNSELSAYKMDELKRLAKKDLRNFDKIENMLIDYLEDEEVYNYLFYAERGEKDVREGMENVIDHILLDLKVDLKELERKQREKWGIK